MNKKVSIIFALIFVFVILLSSFAFALTYENYSQTYFPQIEIQNKEELCKKSQDFLIQIPIDGCSPAVVRSDLLEEQDVPVYCRLVGMKINPLITVPRIKTITPVNFNKSSQISAINFHPARVALGYSSNLAGYEGNLEGVPMFSNLGYVVLFLKKQPVEAKMPENVSATITARITYDIAHVYGIKKDFSNLRVLSDEEWARTYNKYSFWNGRGYLRLKEVNGDQATIQLYDSQLRPLPNTITLRQGQDSQEIPILGGPGICENSFIKLRVGDVNHPSTKALLIVNGDEYLVSRENYAEFEEETGCRVTFLESSFSGYGGELKIKCEGGIPYTLGRETLDAEIETTIDNKVEEETYKIGDLIREEETLYLAYVGRDVNGEDFIVLVDRKTEKEIPKSTFKKIFVVVRDFFSGTEQPGFSFEKASKELKKQDKELTIENLKEFLEESGKKYFDKKVYVVSKSEPRKIGKITEIKLIKTSLGEKVILDRETREFYQDAIEEYKNIAYSYQNLEYDLDTSDEGSGNYYGLVALGEAIDLAEKLGQTDDIKSLMKLASQRYQDSGNSGVESILQEYQERLIDLDILSSEYSSIKVRTSKGEFFIVLREISEPLIEDQNAVLLVNGMKQTVGIGDTVGDYEVTSFSPNSVSLRNINTESEEYNKNPRNLYINEQGVSNAVPLGSRTSARLLSVNLKQEAEVYVVPVEKDKETWVNFTVRIGIEKRAIKLSPEKTLELMEKVNKTINSLEKITNSLEKISHTWTKACYAGTAIIQAKNFLQNLGGEGIARRIIMRGIDEKGGWTKKCDNEEFRNRADIATKTISGCYAKMEGAINKEVALVEEKLKEVNEIVKTVESTPGVKTGKGIFNHLINDKKYFEVYGNVLNKRIEIKELKKGPKIITSEQTKNVFNNLNSLHENYLITKQKLKDLTLLWLIENECSSGNAGLPPESILCSENYGKLFDKMKSYDENLQEINQEQEIISDLEEAGLHIYAISETTASGPMYETRMVVGSASGAQLIRAFNFDQADLSGEEGFYYAIHKHKFEGEDEKYYLLLFKKNLIGNFDVKKICELDEDYKTSSRKEVIGEKFSEMKKRIGRIIVQEPTLCNNMIKNPEIQFWESGAFEGLVAYMPLDPRRGFYVATKAYGTGIKSYAESGAVQNFYIGNVGPNGVFDFDSSGSDDQRVLVNLASGVPASASFCKMTPQEFQKMVQDAINCIGQASKAYNSGDNKIVTSCGTYKIGKPKVSTTSLQCEDVMSPSDCKIIFNLCDPVICPPSRCDFNGRYPVKNVIQTGILGSLVLCAHNFEGGKGVLFPVCVTGLYAGFDSLTTIFKGMHSCLKEQLETGKTVGICDEIKSFYLCEFIWKEITPILKMTLPKITGESKKGGGEYLFFGEALKQAEQSLAFFQDYSGKNILNSFKIKSTSEAGTQICKKFISITYPDAVELFNEITKPESPPQFNARFSEIEHSDVTQPIQSHYKVHYHIYAGREEGIFYDVYLKAGPSKGYYITQEYWPITSGYLNAGDFAESTPDFIAPAGYKEICVRINMKEECGFQKVSTSFAVNELQDLYLQDQLKKEINSEEDCVSGSPSFFPTVGLNLQSQLESALDPEIYRRGINRVCSTQNPGKVVGQENRWKYVGNCGSKEVGCWLDMFSVNDSIMDLGIEQKIYNDMEERDILNLIEFKGYWNPQKSEELLGIADSKLEDLRAFEIRNENDKTVLKINAGDLIFDYNEIFEKSIQPIYKAKAKLGIARANGIVAGKFYEVSPKKKEIEEKEKEKEEKELTEEELRSQISPEKKKACADAGGVWVPQDECKDSGVLELGSIVVGASGTYFSTINEACVEGITQTAEKALGIKYTLGAPLCTSSNPSTCEFDCGSFVLWVLYQNGHTELDSKYRTVTALSNIKQWGTISKDRKENPTIGKKAKFDLSILQPGDLLFFGDGGKLVHVAIYIGNGKMIHSVDAKNRAKQVEVLHIINDLNGWYKRHYWGAKRVCIGKIFVPLPSSEKKSVIPFTYSPMNNPKITSCYGCRNYGTPNAPKDIECSAAGLGTDFHDGIDIVSSTGDKRIFAVEKGRVVRKEYVQGYGNVIVLNHNDEVYTLYAHLESFDPEIEVGVNVEAGQKIGIMGSTGEGTGPHLHFGVYDKLSDVYPTLKQDTGKNPMCYFSLEVFKSVGFSCEDYNGVALFGAAPSSASLTGGAITGFAPHSPYYYGKNGEVISGYKEGYGAYFKYDVEKLDYTCFGTSYWYDSEGNSHKQDSCRSVLARKCPEPPEGTFEVSVAIPGGLFKGYTQRCCCYYSSETGTKSDESRETFESEQEGVTLVCCARNQLKNPERFECINYENEVDCLNFPGCYWSKEKSSCYKCPESCDGSQSYFSLRKAVTFKWKKLFEVSKFENKEECEDNPCGLTCKWNGEEEKCEEFKLDEAIKKEYTRLKRESEMFISEFQTELTSEVSQERLKVMKNELEEFKKEVDSFKLIISDKDLSEKDKEYLDEGINEIYKGVNYWIEKINSLLTKTLKQVYIVSGKAGSNSFSTNNKLVDYETPIEVYVVLEDSSGNLYGERISQAEIHGKTKKVSLISSLPEEISIKEIKWYKIMPLGKHPYENAEPQLCPDIIDVGFYEGSEGLAEEPYEINENYCYYQNIPDQHVTYPSGKSTSFREGSYDVIQYKQVFLKEDVWEISASSNIGTYRYRAEIKFEQNGKTSTISSPGKSVNAKTISEYPKIYSDKNDFNLIDKDYYCCGASQQIHRISRKGSYTSNNPSICSLLPDKCKFIDTIYSFRNVPWIWGSGVCQASCEGGRDSHLTSEHHQTENYIGFECADLIIYSWKISQALSGKTYAGVGATSLAKGGGYTTFVGNYGGADNLLYIKNGEIHDLIKNSDGTTADGGRTPIPIGTGSNELQSGDLLLLDKDWFKGEEVGSQFEHSLIFLEDSNGNGYLDIYDKFLYACHWDNHNDEINVESLCEKEYFATRKDKAENYAFVIKRLKK